jgi:hypothetical protein
LIVSPTKLPWMKDAAVPADPKFAWWNRLREVNCSYVSSRGESERFLYYDGPSAAMSPVRAWLGGETLVWEEPTVKAFDTVDAGESGGAVAYREARPSPGPRRDSIFVERLDGAAAAGAVDLTKHEAADETKHLLDLTSSPRVSPGAAEAWLLEKLTAHGLTKDEAAGVIDCWRDAIFTTPGRRVLTVASGSDYNAACPLTVAPTPTQIVRVAIFWSELGPPKRGGGGGGKAAGR